MAAMTPTGRIICNPFITLHLKAHTEAKTSAGLRNLCRIHAVNPKIMQIIYFIYSLLNAFTYLLHKRHRINLLIDILKLETSGERLKGIHFFILIPKE
jgi:hypothetical protein